jgi:glycosyltransferase involved in cell wall biosynthesis
MRAARRLAVLTPYAVAPPRHGPQVRVAGILDNLGPDWDVVHFSQSLQRTDLPWPPKHVRGGPHWVETRMRDPLSFAWLVGMSKLARYPAVYADRLLSLGPRRDVKAALASADAVLVSPHYQFRWVRRHTPAGVPIVVDCHCVEAEVWKARTSRITRAINDEIRRGELEAWRCADCVFATRAEEADYIREIGAREVVVVPNAADVERIRPVSGPDERALERDRLGLPTDKLLAIFVGSSGYSNVEAADIIAGQAADLARAGVAVVVAGRVGIGRESADGLRWVGEVDDVADWLRAADIALCPLEQGSGTSLKAVEYLAAGLPLVTTAVGVRGLSVTDEREALVVATADFPRAVARLVEDAALRERLGAAARAHAVEHFSWQAAGRTAAAVLARLADGRPAQSNGARASRS